MALTNKVLDLRNVLFFSCKPNMAIEFSLQLPDSAKLKDNSDNWSLMQRQAYMKLVKVLREVTLILEFNIFSSRSYSPQNTRCNVTVAWQIPARSNLSSFFLQYWQENTSAQCYQAFKRVQTLCHFQISRGRKKNTADWLKLNLN